jgi:hypothetical protein
MMSDSRRVNTPDLRLDVWRVDQHHALDDPPQMTPGALVPSTSKWAAAGAWGAVAEGRARPATSPSASAITTTTIRSSLCMSHTSSRYAHELLEAVNALKM